MVIYIDTREKKNAHIMSYFLRHGIVFQSKKLDCGDYWAEGSPVIIERKSSLLELAGNITKDGGKRISAELKRIPADKRLVLLVEENISLDAVKDWRSPRTKFLGVALHRYLLAWMDKYQIEVQFCHKNSSGKRIAALLCWGEGNDADIH